MTRLKLTCEACGSHIGDPRTIDRDRPVRVCCQGELGESEREAVRNLDSGAPSLNVVAIVAEVSASDTSSSPG